MDHDLLMMIYGAVIGVGSSLVTTIFQTWLERREYERRKREDRERMKIKIHIATPEEIEKYTNKDNHSIGGGGLARRVTKLTLISIYIITSICLISFAFYGYRSILFLIVSACTTFIVAYLLIHQARNRIN
jgi:hypothetical protein